MDYNEATKYLYSLTNLENSRRFELMRDGYENVKKVLGILGIDYKGNIIHIAGTKGKGSVAYFSSYLLSKFCGYKVGLFTSPHLLKVNERISVLENGVESNISDEDFTRLVEIIREVKEKYSLNLTTFDFLTVMAMYYFRVFQKVDYIVLEVGLGGRLDSTNFCIPDVSIITLIDYDHTSVLGETLTKIAYEKAGIIKPKVPVISSSQRETVRKVFRKVAKQNDTKVFFIDEIYNILDVDISINGTESLVEDVKSKEKFQVSFNLIGQHFVDNLLLAYEGVRMLCDIPKNVLQNLKFDIKGRFEVIKKKPLIVFDVAHTPMSVDVVLRNFVSLKSCDKFDLIVSLMKDKEITKIAKVVSKYFNYIDRIFLLELDSNDGSKKLYDEIRTLGFRNVYKFKDFSISKDTLVFGSFRIYEVFSKI